MTRRNCDHCGGSYAVETRYITRGKGRFCMRDCAIAWSKGRPKPHDQSGAANPNWKGGVSQGSHTRYTERFKAKNPEKVKAHAVVSAALRNGSLVRPAACSACSKACKPQAHHDDYGKPLEVRWLCVGCHVRHHHLGRKKAESDLGALEVDLRALERQDLRERRHEVRS
jgi:hypothetical protein